MRPVTELQRRVAAFDVVSEFQPSGDQPTAIADLGSLSGDLDRLARGRKARVQMQVELFGDDTPGVVFEGTYIVLPAKPFGSYEEGGNEEE